MGWVRKRFTRGRCEEAQEEGRGFERLFFDKKSRLVVPVTKCPQSRRKKKKGWSIQKPATSPPSKASTILLGRKRHERIKRSGLRYPHLRRISSGDGNRSVNLRRKPKLIRGPGVANRDQLVPEGGPKRESKRPSSMSATQKRKTIKFVMNINGPVQDTEGKKRTSIGPSRRIRRKRLSFKKKYGNIGGSHQMREEDERRSRLQPWEEGVNQSN